MNDGHRKRQANLPQETEVLIVGGGPVGLSAAIEMGQRGVQCVVVEPRLVVSQLRPRAKTTSVRTMEHFRRWGLAERLREAAPLKVGWSQDVVFCTALSGHEVMRFTNCFGLSPQRNDLFAESGQQISQPLVEEVLREAVTNLESCHLGLGWSLHILQQNDDGVLTTIVNEQGEQRQVKASYVVGCDGARSAVRTAIGASYVGKSDLRPNFGFCLPSVWIGAKAATWPRSPVLGAQSGLPWGYRPYGSGGSVVGWRQWSICRKRSS